MTEQKTLFPKSNRVLVFPLITFIVFIATGIKAIITGIEHHQTWRIVTASIGCVIFLFLTVMTGIAVVRNWKNRF